MRVGDPIPLSLERLAKAPLVSPPNDTTPRNLLIWKMDAITGDQSPMRLREAMTWVHDAFFHRISLGILGLSAVGWSAAVTWVLGYWSREGILPKAEDRWVQPLINFCFWTSAAGSRSEGRRKFERNSLNLGWRAGQAGRPFPFWRAAIDDHDHRDCLLAARLAFAYTRVNDRLPDNDLDVDGRERLMSGHKWLFLGPYQHIGRDWSTSARLDPRIEWDHIFPRVRADRFLKTSYVTARTGKKQWTRSEFHKWTNRIGNFAGIASTANRAFSDRPLQEKLAYNKKSEAGRKRTYMDHEYLRTDPKLDARSCQLLFQLHRDEAKGDREAGGKRFEQFAQRRGDAIWRTLTQIMGDAPTSEKVKVWLENGWVDSSQRRTRQH